MTFPEWGPRNRTTHAELSPKTMVAYDPDARLLELFNRAAGLSGEARARFLDSLEHEDVSLRSELQELLRHSDRDDPRVPDCVLRAPPGWIDGLLRGRPALPRGTAVGPYRIQEPIGEGGTGTVYTAQKEGASECVALKVLGGTHSGQHTPQAQLERLVAMGPELGHPHLVRLLEHGYDAVHDTWYLAMEYVDGEDLEMALLQREGRPPEGGEVRALVRSMAQVARALEVLHHHGLVHGDVKPANIVRVAPDHAVLVDLGTVRAVDKRTATAPFGTPSYLAPEVWTRGRADARSDIYSLGLVLHDVVAAPSAEERRRDALRALRPRLRGVGQSLPVGLSSICGMATETVPSWRYSSAAGFARDLESWLDARPLLAARFRLWRRARRWTHDRAATVSSVLVWLPVVALAVVLLWAALPWLAPRPTQNTLAAGRGIPTDDALEMNVRAMIDRGEVESALRWAAACLERNGLARHPQLASWLVQELDGASESSGAIALVGRLFHERPVVSKTELGEAEGFRRVLQDRLSVEEDQEAVLWVLTALSGCGDLEVLHFLLDRYQSSTPSDIEEQRLALHTLWMLLLRSRHCGYLSAMDAATLTRVLALAEDWGSERVHDLESGLCTLAILVALVQRDRGFPVTRGPFPGIEGVGRVLRMRAARREPALWESLRRGPGLLTRHMHPFDPQAHWTYGFLVGLIADPGLVAKAPEQATEVFRSLDTGAVQGSVASGLAYAQALLDFDPGIQLPDEDTHMGCLLEGQAEWVYEPTVAVSAAHNVLAKWDFKGEQIQIAGRAETPALRSVRFFPDEVASGIRFARLGLAGTSAVRLEFDGRVAPNQFLKLKIDCQKGLRSLLPSGGRAFLEIVANGRSDAFLPINSASPKTSVLNLPKPRGPPPYVLEILLHHRSTTTLRLHEVTVEYR